MKKPQKRSKSAPKRQRRKRISDERKKAPTARRVKKTREPKPPRFRTDHFALTGLPSLSLFIDRDGSVQKILDAVQEGWAHVAVTGDTGSGKTSLLTKVRNELGAKYGKALRLAKFGSINIDAATLVRLAALQWGIKVAGTGAAEEILNLERQLSKDLKYVLMIDEVAHFDMLDEREQGNVASALCELTNLRYNDGENTRGACTVIAAGLPNGIDALWSKGGTLRERFGIKIQLKTLDPLDEIGTYIEKYLRYAGVGPKEYKNYFAQDAVEQIYRLTKGLPRDVNATLRTIVEHLPQHGKLPMIDEAFVKSVTGGGEPERASPLDALTATQQEALRVLKKFPEGLKTNQFAQELVKKKLIAAKDPRRATSNLCRDLIKTGMIVSTASGNTFVYKLSAAAQRALAKV